MENFRSKAENEKSDKTLKKYVVQIVENGSSRIANFFGAFKGYGNNRYEHCSKGLKVGLCLILINYLHDSF